MIQNPQNENDQYQPGGYASGYENGYDPYNSKPGEPIISNQQAILPQPEQEYNNEINEPKEELNEDATIDYIVRRGFIIKTYGILLSQLAITIIFICLSFIPAIKEYIKSKEFTSGAFFITFIILFLCITIFVCIMFSCFRDTARKVPINYILLLAFTLSMSFYCLIFCSFFEPEDVVAAGILTFAATVGLTVYAIRTKTDFSFVGGLLFCFSFLMVFTIAFYFWIRVTVFWLALGVLVYSLYLIYDTQLIIAKVEKGKNLKIDNYFSNDNEVLKAA